MLSAFHRSLGVAALTASLATVAGAQSIAVFGAAEAAGDKTTLFLLGAGWNPGRLGWQPYASVLGYNLRLDNPNVTLTANVVAPQIGVRYQTAGAGTQLGVGYTFSGETSPFANVAVESQDTPFAAAQWNYWGTGARSFEALGQYGFDTEFLWTRLTGLQRIGSSTSSLMLGGEASLFGKSGTNTFWTTQLGPAVEWRFTPAFRIGLAGGVKIGLSPATNDQTNGYGRLSFLWLPTLK